MWTNFVKTSLRNLMKDKFYSFINLFGLTGGIAVTILISAFVISETGYDKFFTDHDRIYRTGTTGQFADQDFHEAVTPPPLANALQQDFPEVEASTRISKPGKPFVVDKEGQIFSEEGGLYADPNVFEILDYPFVLGNAAEALNAPNAIVLTETGATKYFGKEPAIGQVLKVNESTFEVTGVIKDLPKNSHLKFNMLISIAAHPLAEIDHWGVNDFHTYLKLKKEASAIVLEKKMASLIGKYVSPMLKSNVGITYDELKEQGGFWQYDLIAVGDIHLHSDFNGEIVPQGSADQIWMFSTTAFFILIIAAVNFINLSTARSSKRAKEVGVRKVLGSFKQKLLQQFLTESVVLSLTATILALIISLIFLSGFGQLVNKELSFLDLFDLKMFLLLFLITIFIGIGAGLYPAFYLTSYEPSRVLKGELKSSLRTGWLRNLLVGIQFCISVGLIICTLLINQQLSFTERKKLGFEVDDVIVISHANSLVNARTFKDELLKDPNIHSASVANGLPFYTINTSAFRIQGSNIEQLMAFVEADRGYVETLGLKIVAGRSFLEDMESDASGILLNEAAVKQFGFEPKEIIGKSVTYADRREYKVLGVVMDYHYESLRVKIKPKAIMLAEKGDYLMVAATGNIRSVTQQISTVWQGFVPNAPFEYSYLSSRYGSLMSGDKRTVKLFGVFTLLSIIISCLGLVALVTFLADQRLKEISVRKVLGAKTIQVGILLGKSFFQPVVFGIIIALPVSYYFLNSWLQNFAYRIGIGVFPFVLGVFLSIVIAVVIVAIQTLKTVASNPVQVLRKE